MAQDIHADKLQRWEDPGTEEPSIHSTFFSWITDIISVNRIENFSKHCYLEVRAWTMFLIQEKVTFGIPLCENKGTDIPLSHDSSRISAANTEYWQEEVSICPDSLIFSKPLPRLIQLRTEGFVSPPTFGSILWHFSCCLWFYKASTFHKWKLILSKQMLVSIFCVLEKKMWIWFGWGGG